MWKVLRSCCLVVAICACSGGATENGPIMDVGAEQSRASDDLGGDGALEAGPAGEVGGDAGEEVGQECSKDVPCAAENDFGVCVGVRPCKDGALLDCDAPVPAAEACNGIDDDCDGETDEAPEGEAGTAGLCDDQNQCTVDECQGTAGCTSQPLDGSECNDGDACTVEETCEAGSCVGSAVDCDDGNPCTDEACDPVVGCVITFNGNDCDDGDPCTLGDHCQEGVCGGEAVDCECAVDEDCAALEDGDACNGALACDLLSVPHECAIVPGSVVVCPEWQGADAHCLAPECDPATGDCDLVPANDGMPCEDGDLCTIGQACSNGKCEGGTAVSCSDDNPCTDELCDPTEGCVVVPNSAGCEDGSMCTAGDKCDGGLCVAGQMLACNDGNPCTDDSCLPAEGCLHVPNAAPCDDKNACTTEDACSGGQCVGIAALSCDDGNQCTTDTCDPAVGCGHVENAMGCDDGNACTVGEACVGGACGGGTALKCGDGNACTDDSCDQAMGCINAPNVSPCEDGNICTVQDDCDEGVCSPGAPTSCDDGNVCTADSCDPKKGCVYTAKPGACDDKNACTTEDSCQAGQCKGVGSLQCDDANPCTNDVCLADGGCKHEPVSGACSDGDLCTLGDTCDGGACKPGVALDCDDGNACTADACAAGVCAHSPVAAECSDSNLCTLGDACVDGVCAPSEFLVCDDDNPCTSDACDPVTGCVHKPKGGVCSDADACTSGDACADAVCVPGGPADCDDGKVCTDDSCVSPGGCVHVPNGATCDDGNPCTSGDLCQQGGCVGQEPNLCEDFNPCTDDGCHPVNGCQNIANAVLCSDGDACTSGDVCDHGVCTPAGPTQCDDGNVCTDDSCDPAAGCVNAANQGACDDQNACTGPDLCAQGKCEGKTVSCDDGDACTVDDCYMEVGCVHTPIVPCCGNGKIESPEECDKGAQNGVATGLAECTKTCQYFGAFQRVLRIEASGVVTAGDWNNTYDRIVNKAEDCLVRFDYRLFKPNHVEYGSNWVRFDFQELNAWHNSWDSYAFVVVQPGASTLLGSTYRRGHDDIVWMKDQQQHPNVFTTPVAVDVYCERKSDFKLLASVSSVGAFIQGSWADLKAKVTVNAAACKVRYDNRVSAVPHVEYESERIYFDLEGLHAQYNGWDSYAYVDIVNTVRAGIGAAYRRGYHTEVWKKDRTQHPEVNWVATPVDVYCKDTFTEVFEVQSNGAFSKGTFAGLYKEVVDEGRECMVMYDGRVSVPQYMEFGPSSLRFDMINLFGYHDSWDSYAAISIENTMFAGIKGSYRRGHADWVYRKSLVQHTDDVTVGTPVTVRCEGSARDSHVYTVSAAGADVKNAWSSFHPVLSDLTRGNWCRVRFDGRVGTPVLMEYGDAGKGLLFDFLGLGAFHDGWDSYAGVWARSGSTSGMGGSYRRGHHTVVYQYDRLQNSTFTLQAAQLEFLCR